MVDLTKFAELARNWEALGDADPMFGVLSDPTKHGGKWEVDDFFASGRAHVGHLLRTLRDVRATFEPGTCLDFGCGVGRLTIPLSEAFRHTVGVDVARPMIEAARVHCPAGVRCEFVVNRAPDLRQFADATFDVVHSCLVLQHIPPGVSLRYIAEFFRVTRPGGLVVFQLPAETRTAEQISASHALPSSAYAAELAFVEPPQSLSASEPVTVVVHVTNRGDVMWRHDIPAGRHLSVGNHWLAEDGGRAVYDDGRALLPRSLAPGETATVQLRVQAPDEPGRYVLEVDLVQEHICWFAEHGSPTARTPIAVSRARPPEPSAVTTAPVDRPADTERGANHASRPPLLRRLLRRLRRGTPTFEMHVIPRADVERVIAASGGTLLRAIDDNAAGPGWLSYTYICRRM